MAFRLAGRHAHSALRLGRGHHRPPGFHAAPALAPGPPDSTPSPLGHAQRSFSSLQCRRNPAPLLLPAPAPLGSAPVRPLSLESMQDSFGEFYAWLINSPATTFVSQQLCFVHDVTGLPWWAVIVSTTFAMRILAMFPAHVTSQKTLAKRQLLFLLMDRKIIPDLRQAARKHVEVSGWSEDKAKFHFDRVQQQILREKRVEMNCSLSKVYAPFYLQIPLWISMSLSFRRLSTTLGVQSLDAKLRFYEMSNGGFFLVPNLCLPDHSLLIPCVVGLSFLANLEIYNNKHPKDMVPKGYQKVLTNAFRLVSLAMIPVATLVPSAVSLYWATSGVAGVLLNLAIMSPRVRRAVNIPLAPDEHARPYRHVWENMQIKTRRFGRKIGGRGGEEAGAK